MAPVPPYRPQSADAGGRRRSARVRREACAFWNFRRDRLARSGHGGRDQNVPQHYREGHGSAAHRMRAGRQPLQRRRARLRIAGRKLSPASIGKNSPTTWLAAWWCMANAARARWKKWPPTLREIDIEPIMAEAIVRRMDWSVEAGLKQIFQRRSPQELSRRRRGSHEEARWSRLKLPRLLRIVAVLCAGAGLCLAVDLKPETIEAFDQLHREPPTPKCSRAGAASISSGLTIRPRFARGCWRAP